MTYQFTPVDIQAAVELALKVGRVPHESVSRLRRPVAGWDFTVPIQADGHAIVGLDLLVSEDGKFFLIESNGSNAAASSFGSPDGDAARAAHQVAAARNRIHRAERGTVLICAAPGTGAVAEIVARCIILRKEIAKIKSCGIAHASEPLTGDVAVHVVFGEVEAIAKDVTVKNGTMSYKGIEVLSIGNANLACELVRRGVIERNGPSYALDPRPFHDGPLLPLVHDKAAQQRLCVGTGIEHLPCNEAHDPEAAVDAVMAFTSTGKPAVAKMNGGSGGAGIEFFAAGNSPDAVRRGIAALMDSAAARYGGLIEKSAWPIRVFPFIRSIGYPVGRAHHLWDVRLMALISPGHVNFTFGGIRLCPAPFIEGDFDRGAVLSNVTGRAPDLSTTLTPLVEFGAPTKYLRAGGVDEQMLNRMVLAAARWCEAAWAAYSTTTDIPNSTERTREPEPMQFGTWISSGY